MIDAFRATGDLSTPNGLGLPEELHYARTRTSKPLVTPLGGPVTFAFHINPGKVYGNKNDIAWAFAPLINAELKRAVEAGATHIQLDEPSAIDDFVPLPDFVELFKKCVAGLNATLDLHICFGNFMGRPAVAHRTYERADLPRPERRHHSS